MPRKGAVSQSLKQKSFVFESVIFLVLLPSLLLFLEMEKRENNFKSARFAGMVDEMSV